MPPPLQRSKGLFGSHSQQGTPLGSRTSLAVSRHPLTPTPAPALLLQAMEEDGSAPGHPCSFLHSSNARKGLLLLLRYTLHVKQATTNTPASCVKERIYSARTQYSIAKKAIGSLKKNKQNNQPNNHQTFEITTKASKSLPTLQPSRSSFWPQHGNQRQATPAPAPSLPGKGQRVALVPRSASCRGTQLLLLSPGCRGCSRRGGTWPAVCSGAIVCSYLGVTHTKENRKQGGL